MWQAVERWTRDLAKRVGVSSDVPPATVIACLVLVTFVAGWAAWRWWPQGDTPLHSAQVVTTTATEGGDRSTEASNAVRACVVHVVGAVRRPGVYRLDSGSRVCDAVDAAGGLLGDAVVEGLNLARVLTDGEQVFVPDSDDAAATAPPGVNVQQGVGASAPSGPGVDLNTADAALLDTLPGIGPSTAEKIIGEREANGPFTSVDDLGRVSGIGPKKIEALKDVAYVR